MGDWAYVLAGYALTAITLVAYVVSLRRRADAHRRSAGRAARDGTR